MHQSVCRCDEAERNRRRIARGATGVAPLMPPNDDGERVCAFCWEVVDSDRTLARAMRRL